MSLLNEYHRHVFKEPRRKSKDAICYVCKSNVSLESKAFHTCHGCGFNFHKDCLTVTYPKCHEHTLTFIRRKTTFPCDVCGLKEAYGHAIMYGCLHCDFFVHRQCIYLPKVIKITRHSHRLCHILHIPYGTRVCEICRGEVGVGYGGYSCINKTCRYVIHSSCIIRYNVWDGKDVEGEPEEEASEVDLAPSLVEDIDGKSIHRHFSHGHGLLSKLEEESEQVCQACILPTNTGRFLGCNQCDFALHDTCASLPRKMEHGLHHHPVTLHVETMYTGNGFFICSVCYQYYCGFMYKCIQKDCGFKMDVKCASFVEPFNNTTLPHPLYLLGLNESIYRCYNCNQTTRFPASYIEYGISFDFKCVNLPGLMKHKLDDHPLTLHYRMPDHYGFRPLEWCEICEEVIGGQILYTCNHCFTTLHVDCVLGKYPYLKYGHRIKVNGSQVEITSNDGCVSRPICQTCHRICQGKQVFYGTDHHVCFCSIECIPTQVVLSSNKMSK